MTVDDVMRKKLNMAKTDQWTLERCSRAWQRATQTDQQLPVTRGSWRSREGHSKVESRMKVARRTREGHTLSEGRTKVTWKS